MNVFGRVTKSWVDVEDIIKTISCSGLCVYEHEQDKDVSRTHIHFYIEECTMTIEGIKKRIKKEFPDITKSDWAFNTKDVNRSCVTYMSKGHLEPVLNTIDGLDSNEYKELWEDKKPSGKMYQSRLQYVTRESASEAKKRKNDLIKEMLCEINERNPNFYNNDQIILESVIKILNDNNIIFGRYTVRDYYDTIQSRRDPESFVKTMKNFCCYKV